MPLSSPTGSPSRNSRLEPSPAPLVPARTELLPSLLSSGPRLFSKLDLGEKATPGGSYFILGYSEEKEITRANKGWALDSVVLCNEVTKWMKDDITAPPAEGVYVYGLYLEGAGWDKRNMKLIDSKPKVLFEMMPVIRIYAENNREHMANSDTMALMMLVEPRGLSHAPVRATQKRQPLMVLISHGATTAITLQSHGDSSRVRGMSPGLCRVLAAERR
uniref:Uncharacterized protein n=1 Tax=Sphaerodactylus townsendi TaxID=933632 RepID=A0ACB8FC48_9SAUR